MRLSILTKNVLGIILILSFLFLVGFYFHYVDLKKFQLESAAEELGSSSNLMAIDIANYIRSGNSGELRNLIEKTIRYEPDIKRFIVTDKNGSIIAANKTNRDNTIWVDSVENVISRGLLVEVDVDDNLWMCRSAITIPPEGNDILGILTLEKSLKDTQSMLKTITVNHFMLYLVALLGMILITIWITTVSLVNPIINISKAMKAVAAGDYSRIQEIDTQDEISDLYFSFNIMTERLVQTRDELEHHNKDLREKVEEEADKLKIAARQLHQNEKLSALGQLIAGVAHELNNPLAVIMGNSQLLLALDLDDEASRKIKTIYQSAERSQKIIQNLLSFARQAPSKKTCVGINGIISDCLELKSYDYNSHKIETITDFQDDLPKTMADFNQIQQVCIIILENAQHALMSNDGPRRMWIQTELQNDMIRIKFADNGQGIPEDIQNRIFEPFFTTKERGKGTGLGLSIAYGIIKKHNGKFYVESRPGEGAAFIIELPVTSNLSPDLIESGDDDKAILPLGADKREKQSSSGRRILVVDDEDAIIDMLFNILKTDGHQVDTARNGKLALDKILNNKFDIIICDVKMPVMNGEQLYEVLKEKKPEISEKMIFMSGDIINQSTIRFLKTSGCMYLGKPFKIESLKNCISSVLSSKEYVEPVGPSVFVNKSF